MLPDIGTPASVAKLTTLYAVPYLVANSSVLHICATHTGVRLKAEPLKTPYKIAKPTSRLSYRAPRVTEGSHRAKMDTADIVEHKTMTLNLPIRSAINPGKARPTVDAEFRMASMCGEIVSKPLALAYVVM